MENAVTVRMRVIVVVAQGCVSKVRTKSFNSIPHRYRRYHTGVRELRETRITGVRLRATASGSGTLIELQRLIVVPLYRCFYHRGSTIWHRGGAQVEEKCSFFIESQNCINSTKHRKSTRTAIYNVPIYRIRVWCLLLAAYRNTEYLLYMVLLATYRYAEYLYVASVPAPSDKEQGVCVRVCAPHTSAGNFVFRRIFCNSPPVCVVMCAHCCASDLLRLHMIRYRM